MSGQDFKNSSGSPRVTIVVSPRERFGMAQRSLESIYATADIPFELIYVDGRSPRYISDWLKQAAPAKGFSVIHLDRFVTPNEARNLGAAAAKTEFVVFIDNDVICADGWLSALVRGADETGAEVVEPVVCEGAPVHSRVHRTTGTFTKDKAAFFAAPHGTRELIDEMGHFKEPFEKIRDQLHREETDSCEFHCLLVRRAFFEKIGPLDEDMYSTKEHIDFSMSVLKAGGKLIFEPKAVVTYLFPTSASPVTREDIPYFLLRWSPQWQIHSLDHMQEKWGLHDGGELADVRDPDYMRMRQYQGYIKPLIAKMPVVRRSWKLTKAAGWLLRRYVDRRVEGLAAEYERQRARHRVAGAR